MEQKYYIPRAFRFIAEYSGCKLKEFVGQLILNLLTQYVLCAIIYAYREAISGKLNSPWHTRQ